jgi:hypothetical protein
MKILLTALLVLGASRAYAFLPNSAYSSAPVTIYGVYTTADPTCQTGFVATIPINGSESQVDLTLDQSLGAVAATPATIGCAIVIMKNSVGPIVWKAGTYTGTTGSYTDTPCNTGGTTGAAGTICNGTSVVSWPASVLSAVQAAGLTGATTASCSGAGTLTDAVPLYISTASACTGNPNHEPDTSCVVSGNDTTNAFQPPTASNDTAHGLNMTAPTPGGSYQFFIDPSYSFGATSSSQCGGNQPSIMGFKSI